MTFGGGVSGNQESAPAFNLNFAKYDLQSDDTVEADSHVAVAIYLKEYDVPSTS